MSSALERLKQRNAEKAAAMQKESEVKKQAIANKLNLSAEQESKIAEQEKAQIAEREEQRNKGVDLPATIYEVEGLDPERLVVLLEGVQETFANADPRLKGFLREILQNVKQFPEIPYMLSDDQVGIITRGLLQQANVEISVTAAKKKSAKSTAQMSLKDMDLSNISF